MYMFIVLLLALCHISEGTYVVSWGDNQYGQLGLGHLTSVFAATQVTAYDGVNIARIRIGLSTHFAMASDGSVYCGGNNAFGQLGIGSSVSQEASPIRNTFAFGLDSYPIGPQTIGYNASTKDVYGWGFEAGYMVPSFTGNALTPRKSTSPDFAGIAVGIATGWSASFVFLSILYTPSDISKSFFSAKLDGGAYAAGKVRNYGGYTPDSVAKLGINVTSPPADFVRMSFWNNVPLQYLFDSGSSHICAIAKNHSLYCWGKNTRGQLGLGDNTDRALPSYVPFVDQDDVYVARVVTGDAHTAGGGKVYTWGSNSRGNLGLGSKDSYVHATPTLVESLSSIKIVEIASGFNTVFARNSTNHWYVWGSNDMNMTLYGTGDVLAPTLNPIFRETGLTHIAANSKSNFAFAWVDPNPWSHIAECPPLVDECRLGMASCAPNTKCVDTERSYKCICGSGFQGDGISIDAGGTGCEDIDECLTDICGPQAICENQLGSFACVCPDGFTSEGLVVGSNCTDIDECSEGGYCPPNTDCVNIIGSFNCSCTAGFRQIGTSACGPICTDIDECNTLVNPCGANTVCNNFDGSFNCSCNKGFSGPSCADINECITGGHNCAIQSFCTNLPGTFTCKCPNGFEGDGVSTLSGGVGCLDINECENSPCHPNATCANSVGSFGCTCNSGFSGNGIECIDNDECASTNNCVTPANNGICTNTEGSYSCSCKIGYHGNGILTSTSGGTGCSDINECLVANNCDPVAYCTNTQGNYTCSCPSGYKGSGNKCYTVNCAAGQYPVTATTCAACPAGTYNDQTDVEKCAPCPAGTYSAGVGKTSQSTCLSCPKNTYSNLGSSSCTTCPLGSVSVAGSGECSPCPAGQYGTQGSCKSCGAGWFSSPGSAECQPCPPGTFSSSSSSSSCDVCPAGTFSKGRASSCTTCGAGRYSEAGQYYCKQCAPGTSTLGESGAASCTPCPAGSFANLAGSGQCSVCSAGTYSNVNGSDSCTACIPGTYQNNAGQTSCKLCDNWRYSDVSAAVTCATCYQGYAAEKEYGSTSCFACPPGMYRTNGDTVCLPCHAGSASEKAGIPHCTLCMGGFYQPRCGRTTCEVCDLNSYSLYRGTGSTKCNYCPFGQESFGTAYFCFGE